MCDNVFQIAMWRVIEIIYLESVVARTLTMTIIGMSGSVIVKMVCTHLGSLYRCYMPFLIRDSMTVRYAMCVKPSGMPTGIRLLLNIGGISRCAAFDSRMLPFEEINISNSRSKNVYCFRQVPVKLTRSLLLGVRVLVESSSIVFNMLLFGSWYHHHHHHHQHHE